ncbi:MAG: GNAT family N-acetyltransferase [Phyllobacterium sp.]
MTIDDVVYVPELPVHDAAIEDINQEAFGPGRFVRAAYRIRERGPHDRALSFVALVGDEVVASVRMTPIRIGAQQGKSETLLLGPLAVRPAWKNKGIGRTLLKKAMETAQAVGYGLVVLVGDEPYYGPFGFRRVPANRLQMPAPVDPARLLACELKPHSLDAANGMVKHAEAA